MTAEINSKVKSVVSNIRNLPTPPIVFHQIQKVINDPNVSADKVASILSEDPAMSVKVLRLTNSAFYGLSKEIESVKQAVIIVGFEAIKNLVLSASVLDMFKNKDSQSEEQENYWRHSLSTAICCRILARKLKSRGMVDPDSAFSAGLLHDVGKMVISTFLPDEYCQFKNARLDDSLSSDYELENKLFGFNHAQIGGVLGMQWKIPQKLIEAIIRHHNPDFSEDGEQLIYNVYLGNYIAKKTFSSSGEGTMAPQIASETYDYFGISEEDIVEFCELLREEYAKSETFMQMVAV